MPTKTGCQYNQENLTKDLHLFCGPQSRLYHLAQKDGNLFALYEGGQLRHEISDEGSVLKFDRNFPKDVAKLKQGTTLGEVLDHPALFVAYPELRTLPVRAYHGLHRDMGAGFDVRLGIGINADHVQNDHSFCEQLKGYVLHEVQHAIQAIDGSAPGSNPFAVEQFVLREDICPHLDEVVKLIQADPSFNTEEIEVRSIRALMMLVQQPNTALKNREIAEAIRAAGFDEEALTEVKEALDELKHLRRNTVTGKKLNSLEADIAQRKTAAYQATPGEIEAHLTVFRTGNGPSNKGIPVPNPNSEHTNLGLPFKTQFINFLKEITFRLRMRSERVKQLLAEMFDREKSPSASLKNLAEQSITPGDIMRTKIVSITRPDSKLLFDPSHPDGATMTISLGDATDQQLTDDVLHAIKNRRLPDQSPSTSTPFRTPTSNNASI